uniref:Uncharacterized protein n=1 Tax=Rhizochromulina marina TaxID=1034831 RepID=A0A7S2R6C8_9STRA
MCSVSALLLTGTAGLGLLELAQSGLLNGSEAVLGLVVMAAFGLVCLGAFLFGFRTPLVPPLSRPGAASGKAAWAPAAWDLHVALSVLVLGALAGGWGVQPLQAASQSEGGQSSAGSASWVQAFVEGYTFSFHEAFILGSGVVALSGWHLCECGRKSGLETNPAVAVGSAPSADAAVFFCFGGGLIAISTLMDLAALAVSRRPVPLLHFLGLTCRAVALFVAIHAALRVAQAVRRGASTEEPPSLITSQGPTLSAYQAPPSSGLLSLDSLFDFKPEADQKPQGLHHRPPLTLSALAALPAVDAGARDLRALARACNKALALHGLTFQLEALLLVTAAAYPADVSGAPAGPTLLLSIGQALGFGMHGAGITVFCHTLALHDSEAWPGFQILISLAGLGGAALPVLTLHNNHFVRALRTGTFNMDRQAPNPPYVLIVATFVLFILRIVSGVVLFYTYARLPQDLHSLVLPEPLATADEGNAHHGDLDKEEEDEQEEGETTSKGRSADEEVAGVPSWGPSLSSSSRTAASDSANPPLLRLTVGTLAPWFASVLLLGLVSSILTTAVFGGDVSGYGSQTADAFHLFSFPSSYGLIFHFAYLLTGFFVNGILFRFPPSLDISLAFTCSAAFVAVSCCLIFVSCAVFWSGASTLGADSDVHLPLASWLGWDTSVLVLLFGICAAIAAQAVTLWRLTRRVASQVTYGLHRSGGAVTIRCSQGAVSKGMCGSTREGVCPSGGVVSSAAVQPSPSPSVRHRSPLPPVPLAEEERRPTPADMSSPSKLGLFSSGRGGGSDDRSTTAGERPPGTKAAQKPIPPPTPTSIFADFWH